MMRSSWMTSRAVLRSFVPCFLTQLTALGSVFCSMPLGLIAGRAATPFNRAISARSSPTVCCNAAFSASRRSVKASRSPRDRPEREIFSGADTPGKIGARQARRNLTLLHTCPAFCPSYDVALAAIDFLGVVVAARPGRRHDLDGLAVDD